MANIFKKIGAFFKQSFKNMKESAKMQHEIDKANFETIKKESSISVQRQIRKEEQEKQLAEAIKRRDNANIKYQQAKGL